MVTVRLADLGNPTDQASIVELLDMYCRDAFGDAQPLSDEARRNLVPGLRRHGGARVFLAHEGVVPAGLAICLLGFSSFRGRPLLNIHDIAVAPQCRRHGVGRALLAAVELEARKLGCCKVTLEVRSDNTAAQQLYVSEGITGTKPETWFWSKSLGKKTTGQEY